MAASARHSVILSGALVAVVSVAFAPGGDSPDARVDFGRDVRPILSNHCFACHGPDEGKRKAGLRLDTADGATAELRSGHHAIVPGDLNESALVERITHESAKKRMPPERFGKPLSDDEVAKLKRWVEQGGEYKKHWSLVPPRPAAPPAVKNESWPRDDVDRFLLARMEQEGLAPSPEASREALLRRATLALTGLPPTPAELDAFLADAGADAYEKEVRRLLASPRFGEHVGRYWLDAARYGDTHGYHLDNERSLWRWREWVVGAFNRNEPFDQFTIEQLAGDLLPDPTPEQRIATGYLRCNPTTGEGGLIEEEYQVKYVVDRVNTTSAIWLGLTVGCCQCHDHKFDPLTQRDYYGMFALFNNIAERGTDDNALSPAPSMKAPAPEQAAALADLNARIAAEEAKLALPMAEVDAAQAEWEEQWRARLAGRWRVLEPVHASSSGGTTFTRLADDSLLAGGANPDQDVDVVEFVPGATTITALKLDALADRSLPLNGPGRFDNGNFVLTGFEAAVVAADGAYDANAANEVNVGSGPIHPIEFADAFSDHAQETFPVTNAIDGDAASGWAILPQLTSHQAIFTTSVPVVVHAGETLRVRLRFESRFVRHAIGRIRISATGDAGFAPATLSPWRMVGPFKAADGNAAYVTPFEPEAGSLAAPDLAWTERPEWLDGKIWNLEGDACAWYLARTIEAPTARAATLAFGSDDALKVWLNGSVILDRNVERSVKPDQDRVDVELKAGANRLVMKLVNYQGGAGFWFEKRTELPDGMEMAVAEALARAPARRSDAERLLLRDHFRRRHSPEWKAAQQRVAELEQERARLDAAIPPTMVAEELAQPRLATILIRGQYDKRGDPVAPAIPAVLGALPPDAPRNRLAFARWLVSRDNPLTARVFVNRVWAQLFGIGIVKTPQDFGAQGEWPVHQELLDRLACDFVASGWDVKRLYERLVTSAAFRQSAAATPAMLAKDRDDRLLERGPRFRLDAEAIRDEALYVSGLLVERIGGRSVKPYQPGDLWKVVAYPTSSTAHFVQDHGEALWRRSLYTFWKRTSPPPDLNAFDAPSRESCTLQRPRTNTPLQALVLLNDEQFVEAARVFAARIMKEGGASPEERATCGFRWCTSRRPDASELAILVRAHERELAHFRADAAAADALIRTGEAPLETNLDPADLAAWTLVATTLLNLDETLN